jgi:hypothetical protein
MARAKKTWRPMKSRKAGKKNDKRIAENIRVLKKLSSIY